MRVLILLAGAALTLGACGRNNQSGNTANVDDSLTAENIVANDVTAIDAVTGDAANMAADVDYANELENGLDNSANSTAPAKTAKPSKPATSTARAAAPAATNQANNTTE
jgi:hypothetical protein